MRTLCALAFATGAIWAPGQALEHRAIPETTIERTFRYDRETALDHMSFSVNGEEEEDMGDPMELIQTATYELVLRDTVLEVTDGQATLVERTYGSLAGTNSFEMSDPMGYSESSQADESSELEGLGVLFRSDGEDIQAEFAEGSTGDEEWLEDLRMDLEFASALPDRAVEEGDEWEIPLEFLDLLEAPAGDVQLAADAEEFGMGEPGADSEAEEQLEGYIRGTFAGLRELDGRQLALIELELAVSRTTEITDFVDFEIEEEVPEDEEVVFPEIESLEQEFTTTGEGEILWDVEAGRMVSLQVTCDLEQVELTIMTLEMDGESLEFEEESITLGTESYEVYFEVQ